MKTFKDYLCEGLDFWDSLRQHPVSAAKYANMLGRRVPELEEIIATDGRSASLYAIEVVKGRWEPGEQAIIDYDRDDLDWEPLFNYVWSVLKPHIEKHPEDREEIEKKFGPRWRVLYQSGDYNHEMFPEE